MKINNLSNFPFSSRLYNIDRVKEQFWSKVDKSNPNGCWVWGGIINIRNGYAYWYFRGKIPIRANRLAWLLTFGGDIAGLYVCHKCDNRSCVNPNHLFLGTHLDNDKDKVSKGRQHKPKGELHPGAKLTESDVLAIRELRNKYNLTLKVIGEAFGIGKSVVCSIANKRTWKHI